MKTFYKFFRAIDMMVFDKEDLLKEDIRPEEYATINKAIGNLYTILFRIYQRDVKERINKGV